MTRETAVRAGQEFARRFGLWFAPGATPDCLLVTGHQPELVHPGVWIKNLVAALAAGRPKESDQAGGSIALNVVVDYDTAAEFGAWVPQAPDGRLARRFVPLSAISYGHPYCQIEPPDRGLVSRFCREGRAALASLGQAGQALCSRWDSFAELMASPPLSEARSLAEWVTALRHLYEDRVFNPPLGYLEVPMQALARNEAFLRLFAHIALDAPRFAGAYNRALADYRRTWRVRSRANPFPDLAAGEAGWELPFWLLTPGVRRRKLYARAAADALELSTADGPLARIALPGSSPWGALSSARADAVVEFLRASGLELRPRALALTLFLRLFLADLFVHGVGGARYDAVLDALARDYFGVVLPPYAVASMSLSLPLPWPPEAEEVASLRQRLSELRYNPQRFIGELDAAGRNGEASRWAQEKACLVRAIQQPQADRRALTRRIEAVNARLFAAMRELYEKTEARLRRALDAQSERQAAVFRGYPFFLHDGERVRKAAVAMLEDARRNAGAALRERR